MVITEKRINSLLYMVYVIVVVGFLLALLTMIGLWPVGANNTWIYGGLSSVPSDIAPVAPMEAIEAAIGALILIAVLSTIAIVLLLGEKEKEKRG